MILWLAGLSFVLLLVDVGFGSLRNWDEGIYAACSLEMHERGSWMTLYLNGEPWVNKPPLYFWMTRLCYFLFGFNEWAVRLPSALCGAGLVLATFLMTERLFNRQTAFFAGLILLASSQFVFYTRQGQLDVPLAFFITVALYFFWMGRHNPRLYLLSGIASGLAGMTKQLVGWMAWPVIFLYIFIRRDWKALRSPWLLAGLGLSVLMLLPWLAHQIQFFELAAPEKGGGEYFLSRLLGYHVADRLTAGVQSDNTVWHYYFSNVIFKKNRGLMLLLIAASVAALSALRTGELKWRRPSESWLFVFLWAGFILLFFTLAASKAKWYLLPWYPAAAVLAAAAIGRCVPQERMDLAGVVLVLCALASSFSSRREWGVDFNPALKAAAPLIMEQVPEGASVILFNPPETEPAIGFYVRRRIEAVRDVDPAQARAALLQLIDTHRSDPTILLIVSRKAAWKALEAGESPPFAFTELARFPESDDTAEDVLLIRVEK